MLTKPVIVGGFVLGALALGVIAILVFGDMTLFTKNLRVVVVFKDSIAGLDVGALSVSAAYGLDESRGCDCTLT